MASAVGRMWVSYLVVFLLFMTQSASVTAKTKTQHTYVVNQSSQPIRATITYYQGMGTSSFYARLIPPKTIQGDEYWGITSLMIYLSVDGSKYGVKPFKIIGDRSIIAFDSFLHSDRGGGYGIDIWLTDYGSLIVKDSDGWLGTIFPDHWR